MTKRITCLLMALLCIVSFTACQSNDGGSPVTPAVPDTIPAITEKPNIPETDISDNIDITTPENNETVAPDTSEDDGDAPETETDTEADTETEIPVPKPIVHTLTFVGDCTLGTMPDWESYDRCFNNVIKDDYKWPFANVIQYFTNDDCTFINLESVLANSGTPEDKQFTFKGPVEYVNILTQNSVEFANLSNNHTYDFGDAGYASTTETLANNNIAYVGRKGTALYTTNSGLRIGVYGVYFSLDEKDMKKDVQFLKENGADVIIAAVHWGIEREYLPNSTQKFIAHTLIDAGVDIVWGHHPHVLQPVEQYKDGIIYYSLGNFSFGGNHNPSDKDTAVLQQQIIQNPDGSVQLGDLCVIPCNLSSVENRNDFKPTPSHEDDARYNRVLSKLGLEAATLPPQATESESTDTDIPSTETPSTAP